MSSFSEAKLSEKLKNLNETQASIVGLSQWTLFHYRQAQRIANTWAQELSEAPIDKKLPLIYLANDVIQQARARRKNEFIDAFGKVLFASLSNAYKQVPVKIRAKIKRSVNVWKERHVLSDSVVRQILADFNKTDGVATRNGNNNSSSISSSSSTSPTETATATATAVFAIPELKTLNDHYLQSNKASQLAKSQLSNFEHQYNKLFAEDSNLPSPNVFHEQITDLLKIYDSLKTSVEDSQNLKTQALQQLEQFVAKEKQNLLEIGTFEKFEIENDLSSKVAKAVQTQKELQDMVDDGLVGGASAEEAAAPEFSPVSSPKPVSAQHELPNTDTSNTNTNTNNNNNDNDNDNNNDSDDDAIPQYENNDSDDDDNDDGNDSDDDQPSRKKQKIQENGINNSASDTKITNKDTNSNTNTTTDGKASPNLAMTDASKLLEALKYIPNTNANNN